LNSWSNFAAHGVEGHDGRPTFRRCFDDGSLAADKGL